MNSCTALASCHYLHNQFEIEFFLQQDGEFLAKIKFACREVMNSIGLSLGIDSSLERNVKYYSEGYGNTGSEKPLNLAINGWLRGCLNNHKLCGKDRAPNFMPPRLLDLNEPTVRLLCDTSKLGEAPYVTLSHCWGTSAMSLKLTSGNMMSLSHGIEQLPQTFKDAIYIARKMGINYLWIDTLCIIQDDSTGDVSNVQHLIDWQKHVKIMDIIYQNCTINIAAASGSGPSSGCFVTREPASVAPCMVNLRKISRRAGGRWARDEISSPYVILGMNPNNVVDLVNSIGNFHLDSRGWVEQERLLSPRVLHFADRQIFWECSETPFACESTVLGTTPHNQHSLSHLPFFNDRPMFDWKAGEPGEQYERWLRILQAFTGRALTKPEDKLPAIAGIARRVQSILCDDYISGLFRSALPQALLWRRDMSAKVKPQLRAVYCSPTWSWAQFEGSINFKWCFYRFAPGRDFASVTDIYLLHENAEDVYGRVMAGHISMRGHSTTFSRNDMIVYQSEMHKTRTYYKVATTGLLSLQHFLRFDTDPESLDWTVATLFLIVRRFDREFGLVLIPSPNPESTRYIRIGLFEGHRRLNYGEEWEYTDTIEVTII